MTGTRTERSREAAREKGRLLLGLLKADAPYEEVVRALRDFEKRRLNDARTPAERLAIQRSTAEDLLSQAFAHGRGWKDFGPLLRRIQRLGYSNLYLRTHVACLYVQALPSFPKQAREAFALLEDAERRVKRLPKLRPVRAELLAAIARARSATQAAGGAPSD